MYKQILRELIFIYSRKMISRVGSPIAETPMGGSVSGWHGLREIIHDRPWTKAVFGRARHGAVIPYGKWPAELQTF